MCEITSAVGKKLQPISLPLTTTQNWLEIAKPCNDMEFAELYWISRCENQVTHFSNSRSECYNEGYFFVVLQLVWMLTDLLQKLTSLGRGI